LTPNCSLPVIPGFPVRGTARKGCTFLPKLKAISVLLLNLEVLGKILFAILGINVKRGNLRML
jgi:hypothetical protein